MVVKPIRLQESTDPVAAIVMPVGPGKETALDTLESIACYCAEPHLVIVIDDCTQDGTYEALLSARQPNWRILRASRPMGVDRLVHNLCLAYNTILSESNCSLVLRIDQDALIVRPAVISDAISYALTNPNVGIFGVYEHDFNRPRSFETHRRLIAKELNWARNVLGLQPSWAPLLKRAEGRGYKPGDNVFGGAYFITRACLSAMKDSGALDVPYRWHSHMMEDVYFSMAAVAAGFDMGHFAAPDGPLCLEWRGLPYPAAEMSKTHYKIIHSVDKGKNTEPEANDGKKPREIFKALRNDYARS
jgi:hypothetical protein